MGLKFCTTYLICAKKFYTCGWIKRIPYRIKEYSVSSIFLSQRPLNAGLSQTNLKCKTSNNKARTVKTKNGVKINCFILCIKSLEIRWWENNDNVSKTLGLLYVGYAHQDYSYQDFLIILNFSLNVSTEASEMMRDISLLFTGRSWLSSLPLWSSLSMLCLVSASWLTSWCLTSPPASTLRSSGRGIWQKRPFR